MTGMTGMMEPFSGRSHRPIPEGDDLSNGRSVDGLAPSNGRLGLLKPDTNCPCGWFVPAEDHWLLAHGGLALGRHRFDRLDDSHGH